eukprot:3692538-Amphidinium_carterae.1
MMTTSAQKSFPNRFRAIPPPSASNNSPHTVVLVPFLGMNFETLGLGRGGGRSSVSKGLESDYLAIDQVNTIGNGAKRSKLMPS